MNRKEWQNAFGEPSDAFSLCLHQTLNHLEEKEMKKRYKISTALIAVALMLALLAGASFAANQLGIFEILNTADPIVPLEGAEKMVGINLGSAENDYATLCVEEAVFDGQGVLVKCRLTPKDREKYALYDDMMQTATDELYDIERTPVRAAEGALSWTDDGNEYALINESGVQRFTINGEEMEIPSSFEDAKKRSLAFYAEDGVLYYTGSEMKVIGRKDGKEMMGYWISISVGDSLIFMNTADAKEDDDGSIVWWESGIADEILDVDEIEMHVKAMVQPEDQQIYTPEIVFTLPRSEEQRKYDFTPETGAFGEGLDIISAKMVCTRVRGYVQIEYCSPTGEALDVDFCLYDASGDEIKLCSGGAWEENGVYHWQMEMQSYEELPEIICLEARHSGESTIEGKAECKVIEE